MLLLISVCWKEKSPRINKRVALLLGNQSMHGNFLTESSAAELTFVEIKQILSI